MPKLQDKLMVIPCTTEHPDFAVACLTPVVLRIAIVARNDMRKDGFQDCQTSKTSFKVTPLLYYVLTMLDIFHGISCVFREVDDF